MGMHIGIVAARASVADLREAFAEAWPDWEVAGTANQFESVDAAWSWMEANEQFVSADDWTKDNPGKQTCLMCQDGEWALLIDPSYTLATDEDALQRLSSSLGKVLSFVVESTGGCAFFWCYTFGELRRSISYSDGEVKLQGESLPEEAGIDVQRYYMDETQALMRAFGVSPIEQLLVPQLPLAWCSWTAPTIATCTRHQSASRITPYRWRSRRANRGGNSGDS